MNYITRDEAIKLSNLKAVESAENDNAEFHKYDDNETTVVSCGSHGFYDNQGFNVTVRVFYEHNRADYDAAEQLDALDWTIAGYIVE